MCGCTTYIDFFYDGLISFVWFSIPRNDSTVVIINNQEVRDRQIIHNCTQFLSF